MATRRKSAPVATFADGSSMTAQELAVLEQAQQDNELEDELEQDSGDRVAALLGVSGTSGISQVRVYKIVNLKSSFCANYTPDEFEEGNFEMIRQQFGPGSYKVYLYGNNPTTGKYGIRTHSPVEIADVKMPKAQAMGAVPQNGNDSAIAAVLAAMADRQARTDDILIKILDKPQADPMATFTTNLALFGQMKELFGGGAKSSIGEIVEAIKELKSAGDLVGGGDKEPESLLGMGSKLIEAIGPMMAQRSQQPVPGAMQMQPVSLPPSMQVATPAEALQQPDHTPPTEEDEMNFLTQAQLQGFLAKLAMDAKSKADIEPAAELVYEHLPDELMELFVNDEVWWPTLTGYAPYIKPHQEWFGRVRARALEMLAEDDDTSTATQTAAAAPAATPVSTT